MSYFDEFNLFFRTGIPSEFLYPSSLLMAIAILTVVFSKKIKDKWRVNLWIMLIAYLYVIICSTIVFRPLLPALNFSRIELMPFWTYRAVLNHLSGVSIWDVILNVVLFLPFGFLVTAIYSKASLWKILVSGLMLSLTIEISQYFFCKGITQFDDIMHNSIGCAIGFGLYHSCKSIVQRLREM